jgi:hypothetical protein
MKVLFMTGYPDREFTGSRRWSAGAPCRQKPFSPSELVRKVRLVLDT